MVLIPFPGTSMSPEYEKFNDLIETPVNDAFKCNVIITYKQMKEERKPNAFYLIQLIEGGILADFCWLFEFLTDNKITKTKLFVDQQVPLCGFKVKQPIKDLKRGTYGFVVSTEASLLCSDRNAQFIVVRSNFW